MSGPFVLARESLSFGNPVSGLVVELLIYNYVDRDLEDADLQELLSSSRYSDNINVGSWISMDELNKRCSKVVASFSKYGLFFKVPIEPWSQLLPGDERLQQEKEVSTLGFLWNLQTDALTSTMEPAVISKKRGLSRNMSLNKVQDDPNLITKRSLAVLTASIVSTDGIISVPLQLGAKLLLSRASVICPGLDSWNQPLHEIDKEFCSDILLSLIHI